MKAISPPEWCGKWVIDLYENPWSPRTEIYRIEGTAQVYDTKEDAEAAIAQLQSLGEQAARDKYDVPASTTSRRKK